MNLDYHMAPVLLLRSSKDGRF